MKLEKRRKHFQYDVILHPNLKPSWNAQPAVEEVKTEKRENLKKGEASRDEDSQSIISYDGEARNNHDSATIQSRYLDNGYAKRLTPSNESVLECEFPKISKNDISEKDLTELKVFSKPTARRYVWKFLVHHKDFAYLVYMHFIGSWCQHSIKLTLWKLGSNKFKNVMELP